MGWRSFEPTSTAAVARLTSAEAGSFPKHRPRIPGDQASNLSQPLSSYSGAFSFLNISIAFRFSGFSLSDISLKNLVMRNSLAQHDQGVQPWEVILRRYDREFDFWGRQTQAS